MTTYLSIGSRFWETSFSPNTGFSVYLKRFNNFSKPLGGSKPCQIRLCGRFGCVLWDCGYLVWEFGIVDMGTR